VVSPFLSPLNQFTLPIFTNAAHSDIHFPTGVPQEIDCSGIIALPHIVSSGIRGASSPICAISINLECELGHQVNHTSSSYNRTSSSSPPLLFPSTNNHQYQYHQLYHKLLVTAVAASTRASHTLSTSHLIADRISRIDSSPYFRYIASYCLNLLIHRLRLLLLLTIYAPQSSNGVYCSTRHFTQNLFRYHLTWTSIL